MFTNKGLFPAYSGLGDIEVAMPRPPSRAQVARSVEDLWETHNSEPHVTAPSDPGIAVPYPDDGFDPSRDFSEGSPAGDLVNRAAAPLSSAARDELLDKLSDEYTSKLVSNLQMSGLSPHEIKDAMRRDCAGSLLVYNGNDKDSLIRAYTLIQSLEYVVENFVRHSTFTEDAKAEMLSFISPCAAVRDALILPDHIIRQRIFGSTESHDNLEHALELFDLHDESDSSGSRGNPADAEFADFLEKIGFAELELDRAVQQDIISGDSHRAMYNSLSQVLPTVKSQAIRDALTTAVMGVRRDAEHASKKTAKSLALLMSKLRKDLESLGVDITAIDQLVARERKHRSEADAKITTPANLDSVAGRTKVSAQRPVNELQALGRMFESLASQLNLQAVELMGDPRAELCCRVEIYTVLCMRDCCAALSLGQDMTEECTQNLKSAVEAELKSSGLASIKPLRADVEKSKNDLKHARMSKTMDSLNRAKSESKISDKKLETLKQIIG
jgi:hypothetical protein